MNLLKKIHTFLTDQERLDSELNWIKKIWYIILVLITSKYVLCNFSELTSFTFFEKFNGRNLIFLVWIVLLLLPFFDNFEGFGIRFNRHIQNITKSTNEKADEIISNHPNKDVEELKKGLEKELENIKNVEK